MPVERVVVDAEDRHLTLSELDPVLENIEDPVEVRWEGTREDLLLWEKWRGRSFVLFVPTPAAADKAKQVTGTPLVLTAEETASAKKDIVARVGSDWRARMMDLGSFRGTLLLTSVVGGSLRSGKRPVPTISVVKDCLFRRVSPADVDVLLRLRCRS